MCHRRLRVISCLLLALLLLPLLPGRGEAAEAPRTEAPPASGFPDAEGHWAWAYLELADRKGLTAGLEPVGLAPDEPLTRAMFITMLYRCAGSPPVRLTALNEEGESVHRSRFSDVPAEAWYEKAAVWAAENRVTAGVGPRAFSPDRPVTREQMCVLTARLAEVLGGELSPVLPRTVFQDDAEIADYAREQVYLLQGCEIVCGTGKGRFAPQQPICRAEAAVVLTGTLRALGRLRPTQDLVEPKQDIDYEQMTVCLRELAINYPWLIRLSSAGSSCEGRDIPMVCFGRGEKYIYTQAGTHAREHQTTNFLLEVLDRYAYAYETEGSLDGYPLRELLDEYTLVMLPRVNPDGVNVAQKGFDAAKDPAALEAMEGAEQGAAQWKANVRGTDINRNFPCFWEQQGAVPASAYYSGPYAASAPETRAVIGVMKQYPYAAFLDIHMAGNVIYFCNPGIDSDYYQRSMSYARKLCARTGYRLAYSDDIRKDQSAMAYARWQFRVPALTVEICAYAGFPHNSARFDTEIWSYAKDLFLEAMSIS